MKVVGPCECFSVYIIFCNFLSLQFLLAWFRGKVICVVSWSYIQGLVDGIIWMTISSNCSGIPCQQIL
uniref:Uncharacterized protein n=1 Tax=Rhizophora mucronata TaxID=61149 RepID=A0A2P2N423_RHIMU